LTTHLSVAIRTRNLAKRYKSGQNDLVIFEDLDLDIFQGEKLALIGESGVGKSTLLHLLGGLDRPTEGSIEFSGTEITTLSETDLADFRNRHVGFVWQTHYLLPEFTAIENVMMPLLIRGVTRDDAAASARKRLAEVGLAARAEHRAGELSGGEQQRVVIARALVGNPRVLLADEPTGNLDYRTGDKVADLFDEIHRTNQLTSVFVTHNIGFARRCSRILKLERGLLVGFEMNSDGLPATSGRDRNSQTGPLAALQREDPPDDTARKDGTNYV
jgi:lipoprotein-releasing system ATP-binding protein